eukprot:gene5847-8068_t
MSGSCRKSPYRKSVTSVFLTTNVLPDTSIGETLAKVTGSRGSNLFDIQIPLIASNDEFVINNVDDKYENIEIDQVIGEQALARLPHRFNKLIWLKKHDFIIVQPNGNEYQINHILNKDNVKYLKSQQLWPKIFELTPRDTKDSLTSTHNKNSYQDDHRMDLPDIGNINDYEDGDYEDDIESKGLRVDSMGNTIEDDDNDKEMNIIPTDKPIEKKQNTDTDT